MLGLLTKDIAVLLQSKKRFVLVFVWAIVMSFMLEDGSFVVGWLSMIGSIFSLTVSSYDEYDNCMPFIMSLPVNGTICAVEKYVFGFICGFGSWLIGLIICVVALLLTNSSIDLNNTFISMIFMIPLFVLLLDINLPINLKYGSEKSRTIMLIIGGFVFAGTMIAGKLIDLDLDIYSLNNLSIHSLLLMLYIFTIIITIISILISIKVMKSKEF